MKKIFIGVIIIIIGLGLLTGCDSGTVEERISLNVGIEGYGSVIIDGEELVVGEELSYRKGTELVLKAIPEADYNFIGWFDGQNIIENKNELFTIKIMENIFLVAKFGEDELESETYTLSLEGDNINSVPTAGEVDENTVVQIIISPDYGKEVDGFTVNGVDKKAELLDIPVNDYAFVITEDTTVSVSYIDITTPAEYFSFDNGVITAFHPKGESGTLPEVLDIVIPVEIDGQTVIGIGEESFTKAHDKEEGYGIYSVVIPETVETIGQLAFVWNDIKEIIIPDSVTSIGAAAFAANDISEVKISKNIEIIPDDLFRWNKISEVVIPDGITEIGDSAFRENKLTEIIIPDGVSKIGSYAFDYNNLGNIIIPVSVNEIGSGVFRGNNLTEVRIPDGVTEIRSLLFTDNTLTKITLGADVDIQDDNSFGDYGAEFKAFYDSNGKQSGTYNYDGTEWSMN